jgi:hypothetical protein
VTSVATKLHLTRQKKNGKLPLNLLALSPPGIVEQAHTMKHKLFNLERKGDLSLKGHFYVVYEKYLQLLHSSAKRSAC